MSFERPSFVSATLIVTLLLPACGFSPDADSPTVAYREAESVKSLEVPPDLTRRSSSSALSVPGEDGGDGTGSTTGADMAGTGASGAGAGATAGSGLLPEFDGVRLVRAGVNTWIEFDGVQPDAVWPRLEDFIRSQGLTIARRSPELGIIETGWAQRYDEPKSGGLTGWFADALNLWGSSSARDRYRLRLERMEDQGTRVFLTHRSAEEVNTTEDPKQPTDFEWAYKGSDPAIEAEMTRRLLVHLGLSEARAGRVIADAGAGPAVHYRQSADGVGWVQVDDANRARVFARVGDGLDEIGAEVRAVRRDRLRYDIAWQPPAEVREKRGLFASLFGDDDPVRMQVRLTPSEGGMRVVAADEGGATRSAAVHKALLRTLALALGGSIQEAPAENVEDEPAGEREGPLL